MKTNAAPYLIVAFSPTSSVADRKIRQFARLKEGWRYGNGGPVAPFTVQSALIVLELLQLSGLTRNDAFAGAGREILVTAYHADSYIAVTVEPDGTFTFSHERGDDLLEHEEGMDFSDLRGMILQGARTAWNISDWPTQTSSIPLSVGSTIWYSNAPPMEACQFLNADAQRLPAV